MATKFLGRVGVVWLGEYAGGTAYDVLDMVRYGGSSYICTAPSTGNLPTDTDYWQLAAGSADFTEIYDEVVEARDGAADLDTRIDAIDAVADAAALKADAMASGSPVGVYATVGALEAALPTGAPGAYLVEADSHIYIWDSVTSGWVDAGEYNVAHASKVAITDTDGYYEQDDVEAALQEAGEQLSYLSTYYTPEMFGAEGDGSTDDTDAVVSAISAAQDDDTYVLFQRQYKITSPITILSEVALIGTRQYRSANGARLLFYGIESDENCITIGTELNSSADRTKRVNIENLNIYCYTNSATGSSVLSIGDVSGLTVKNTWIRNANQREEEYDEVELASPLDYSNYGIKFNGDSEFIIFTDVAITADIPVYSIYPPDFLEFDNVCTVCGLYGYASYYGDGLYGNATLTHISMCQGLYGIDFDTDSLDRLSGVFSLRSFRIEQLRRTLDDDDKNIATNFKLYINGARTFTKSISIHDGHMDGNANGFHFSGNPDAIFPSTIGLTNIHGISQTNLQDYMINMEDISTIGLWVRCINCSYYNGGTILFSSDYYAKGYMTECAINTLYHPIMHNLEIMPLNADATDIKNGRYIAKSDREYVTRFESDFAASAAANILTDIVNTDSDNRLYALTIDVTALSSTSWGKATYVIRFPISVGVIDPMTPNFTLSNVVGDAIFSITNTDPNVVAIYESGDGARSTNIALKNNMAVEVHIIAEITIYTTEKLL